MRPTVKLYQLGRLSYQKALNAQLVISNGLKQKYTSHLNQSNKRDHERGHTIAESFSTRNQVTNSLLLVEHEPVYTIGIRTQQYNDSYVAELGRKLAENNLSAELVNTNRGGLITFHGPGQLVAYPILDLNDFGKTIPKRSVKAYVRLLENTIIDTLDMIGLEGAHTVHEYPGVWLNKGERKIAFIGISCKRFVTMHGVSINCDCDLSWFDHITSCGIEDKAITSIRQELLSKHQLSSHNCSNHEHDQSRIIEKEHFDDPNSGDVNNIANQFCLSFSNNFGCDLEKEEAFQWESVADC